MRSNKLGNKGFTMIELLVVLLIIGILAAVAAPMLLSNSDKAKASEAASTLGMIRQAEREYFAKHGAYLAVSAGNLHLPQEPTSGTAGLGITVDPAKYFSEASYTVALSCNMLDGVAVADFLIEADGADSAVISGSTGAQNNYEVGGTASGQTTGSRIRVQMDNSGKTLMGVTATTSGATEQISRY